MQGVQDNCLLVCLFICIPWLKAVVYHFYLLILFVIAVVVVVVVVVAVVVAFASV